MAMNLLISSFLLFLSPAAEAGQAVHLFQQGNTLYQQEEYAKAIESYEAAIQLGYENAALYYNLGNAYFKSGRLGKSILYYERARRLSPRDPDILFNLEFARSRIVDEIPVIEPYFLLKLWRGLKNITSADQFSILALIFYILMIGAAIIKIVVKKSTWQRAAGLLFIPFFVLFVLTSSLFAIRWHEEANTREGIIMVDRVEVKNSPGEDSSEAFVLHEGTKVRITDESGDYYEIMLSDGNVGWLPRQSLEII